MNHYTQQQVNANAGTSDHYKRYSEHRAKSLESILSSSLPGKLLIIGAGNCNDIDIPQLSNQFTEIHLLDIDEKALQRGITMQPARQSNVFIHVSDITQISETYSEILRNPYGPHIKRTIEVLESLKFPSLGDYKEYFDTVVSQCVASQLVYPLIKLASSPYLNRNTGKLINNMINRVAVNHINEMIGFLKQSGYGLIITDVVSSEAVPIIKEALDQKDIMNILNSCYFDVHSNYYGYNLAGTNALRTIGDNRELDSKIKINLPIPSPKYCMTWKWWFSDKKHYIVQSFPFIKRFTV